MPEWHCRLAVAPLAPVRCEYALTAAGITLPDIGTVPVEGAAFAPKGAPVIIYRDGDGWMAEFELFTAG